MSVLDTLRKSRAKVVACSISTGEVFIKSLDGASREVFSTFGETGENKSLALIAALGLCEEDGSLLFDVSNEKGKIQAKAELQPVQSRDLQDIVLKLYEISGIGKDAVDTAEKKSEASQSA